MSFKAFITRIFWISLLAGAAWGQEQPAVVAKESLKITGFSIAAESGYQFSHSRILNGVKAKIFTNKNFYIPVSVLMDEDMVQMYIGAGMDVPEFYGRLKFSIEAALGNMRFAPDFNYSPGYQNRIAFMFNNELRYQLTKRLGLTAHFNMDIISMMNFNLDVGNDKTNQTDNSTTGLGINLRLGKIK